MTLAQLTIAHKAFIKAYTEQSDKAYVNRDIDNDSAFTERTALVDNFKWQYLKPYHLEHNELTWKSLYDKYLYNTAAIDQSAQAKYRDMPKTRDGKRFIHYTDEHIPYIDMESNLQKLNAQFRNITNDWNEQLCTSEDIRFKANKHTVEDLLEHLRIAQAILKDYCIE